MAAGGGAARCGLRPDGLLIRLRKRSRELGHGMVLVSPGTQMRAALELMKLSDFFAVETSLSAARVRVKNETGGAQLSVRTQAETLTIQWQGDVTAETTPDLTLRTEGQLKKAQPGQRVIIDLGGVAFADSTGVGLMVRLRKQALRNNLNLAFAQPNANVLNVLRLLKIDEFLLSPPTK